jgi:Carbamoyl-phosphate synthase L chain, ATP binding domain
VSVLVLNRRRVVELIPLWLRDLGTGLVLITARSVVSDEVLNTVAGKYEEIVVVDDYDGEEVLVEVRRLAGRYRFCRVVSLTEIDVVRAACIRQELGVAGQSLDSAMAYRDKTVMKSLVAQAGLPVATMRRIESADDILSFGAAHGFPFVVKPACGAGSVGISVIRDAREAEGLTERLIRVLAGPGEGGSAGPGYARLVAEKWVFGEMCEVDGLTALGRVLQCWPARMRWPNLSTVVESRPLSTWMLPPDDALGNRLRQFIEGVVAALPGPAEPTAFHAEIFHRSDGELVLNEIACRPGGAGIVAMYERGLGVNLQAASLRGQAGLGFPPPTMEPKALAGYIWFPPRCGCLRAIPQRCPILGVVAYSTTGRVGGVYHGAGSISDNIAQVLVSVAPSDDIDAVMSCVERWWEDACLWEDEGVAAAALPGH